MQNAAGYAAAVDVELWATAADALGLVDAAFGTMCVSKKRAYARARPVLAFGVPITLFWTPRTATRRSYSLRTCMLCSWRRVFLCRTR